MNGPGVTCHQCKTKFTEGHAWVELRIAGYSDSSLFFFCSTGCTIEYLQTLESLTLPIKEH